MQWSSEVQAHPTTCARLSRTRRRLAILSSTSSIFCASRMRSASSAGALDAQELLDLGEREAEPLRLLDRAHEAHRLVVVGAVPGWRSVGLGEQAAALVVAERLDVHPGPGGGFSDAHPSTVNPDFGTDVKS